MRYKDDPRQIAVRYQCTCSSCETKLVRGALAYYWPRTKTIKCTDCGQPEYRRFLSSVADEEAYAGHGNPI